MILADTCIWIDHLNDDQIVIHPFVIGELACGNLKDRDTLLSKLHDLQMIKVAKYADVLLFIKQRRLMGRGIGYVDAHLLVSTMRSLMTRLWTCDKPLMKVASSLGIAHTSFSGR